MAGDAASPNDVDLEKNPSATATAEQPGKLPLIVWVLGGLAIAAAIAFATALGVTSSRWNKPKDVQVPTACQLLGIKVGTAVKAIGATSNCGTDGKCYNMTPTQMEAYVGTPRFVSMKPNYFSCIDGRHDNEIIATPAGDMGVFLSSAFIFIRGTNQPDDFSADRMKRLLRAFVTQFRSPSNPFYYHTDEHTVEHVISDLAATESTAGMNLDKMTEPDFVPPEKIKGKLLEKLSDLSAGVGCGHVKYMGLAPADYGITSADLVSNTVRALWDLRWGEMRTYFRIDELNHDHGEQAVLSITKIEGCDGFAPLITQRDPTADDSTFYTQQIFVNHEAAVQPFRREVAAWWLTQPGASTTATVDSFYTDLNTLTDKQLLASAVRLAKNRPLFNATVTGKPYTPPYNN